MKVYIYISNAWQFCFHSMCNYIIHINYILLITIDYLIKHVPPILFNPSLFLLYLMLLSLAMIMCLCMWRYDTESNVGSINMKCQIWYFFWNSHEIRIWKCSLLCFDNLLNWSKTLMTLKMMTNVIQFSTSKSSKIRRAI